jgi:hypothetical protein
MNEWIMPLVFGAVFYVLGTIRSRVIAVGKPPNDLSRTLRTYGTVWVVGEGYLMLTLRSVLEGTSLYKNIATFVVIGSLLWLAVLATIAIWRRRVSHAPGPC